MLEAHRAGVDHLGPHLVENGPEGVQARAARSGETAIHPDQRPLVVLEVEHQRLTGERARTDDHLEVAVLETGVPHRHLLDPQLQQRIEGK